MEGLSVRKYTDAEWENIRRRKISILFQDLKLFPRLNVRENLSLIPEENPSAPSVDEMLTTVGMEDFGMQRVETLSFGQRQRIALLRALRKPFELLLLDEPFSHLDEENAIAASKLIEQMVELNKASFILSSLGDEPPINFDGKFSL